MKKTHLSKRALSILMALLMVITSVPLFALPASAAVSTKTLFHYTFDTASPADNGDNLDSVDTSSSYTIDIDGSNGGSGYWDWFDSDHYYFVKTYAKGAVNSNIRDSRYNKNWKITVDFQLFSTDSSYGEGGANNWNHALALYNDAAGSTNTNPIGLQLDGRVRNGDTTLSDGTVYTFSTDKRYKVTYTYHDGIFNIYVENVTDSVASAKVFAYDCTGTTYQGIMENVQGVAIGGWLHNWSTMSVNDLVAYSYQNNDNADDHLKAQYFTTKNLTKNRAGAGDLTKVGADVTWDNTNGATFPSGRRSHQNYFYTTTNSILSNADETTGFTFTFKAKNTEYYWIETFFDYNDGSGFSATSDANGNAITLNPNLSADLVSMRYYYDDGNGGYTYSGWTDNNPSETIANEHLYAIIVQDGAIKLSIDGTVVTKCDKEIDPDLINSLIDNGKLYIGASMFSADPDFVGSIKDFRIYDIALSSTQISSLYADSLANCISIFEKRIANMATNGYTAMYTNIAPAYECYKAAKAGNGNLGDFQTALDNMQPFDEVTSNAVLTDYTVDYAPEETYFQNVIYTDAATKYKVDGVTMFKHDWSSNSTAEIYGVTNGSWKYGAHAYIYYPNAVLLYDGKTTPTIPVNVGFINKDKRYSVNILYLTENESAFGMLNNKWYGYDDSTSFIWPSSNTAVIPIDTNNRTENSNAETINENESNPTTTYRTYKNALTYTKNPTNTYECYSSTDWTMCGQYTYIATDKQIYTDLTNNDPDIVIINYKKLIDKIKAAANDTTGDSNTNGLAIKTELGKLTTDYTEGGLEGIFIAFDSATSIDPNNGMSYKDTLRNITVSSDYDYAGEDTYAAEEEPMDVAAIQCRDDINSSVNLLNTVKLTADHVQIKKIKQAMADYESTMSSMSGVYTNLKAAYDAYLDAVECVDAYEFGDATFADGVLNTVYTTLVNATSAMHAFTYPSWDGTAYYGGNGATGGYHNVIYSSNAANTWTSEITTSNTKQKYTTSKDTVMVYDGAKGDVYYPIVFDQKCSSADYTRISSVFVKTSSYFDLNEAWRGFKSGSTGFDNFYWGEASDSYYDSNDKYSNGTKGINQEHILGFTDQWWDIVNGYCENTNTSRFWYNRLYYTGSGDTTNYYEKESSIVVQFNGIYKSSGSCNYATSTISLPSYVINYYPVRQRINTLSISGINVKQYREGGLDTWFSQIDTLTSINPNNYAYSAGESYGGSTGVEGAVKHCAYDIKTAVNTTNGTTNDMATSINQATANSSAITADTVTSDPYTYDNEGNITGHVSYASATTPYQKLKIAILEAKTAPPNQQCITNTTWKNFTDPDYYAFVFDGDELDTAASSGALECAKYAMARVDSSLDDGYGSGVFNATKIDELADYLHDSIAALSMPANSQHNMIFSYRDGHDVYFQCSTNNAHTLCIHSGIAKSVIAADATAYDELGIVYNTIDLEKYTAAGKTAVTEAKSAYDSKLTDASAKIVTAYSSTTADHTINEADNSALQDYLDAGTSALLTAINEANNTAADVSTYALTFNVYTVDGTGATSVSPVYTDSSNSALRYGQRVTFSPKSEAALSALSGSGIDAGNMGIQKWQLITTTADGTTKTRNFNTQDDSFTAFVQENATINVYVSKLVPESQIAIKNLSGATAYALNVNDNTTVAISNSALGTVTIGGTGYAIPNTLSYDVKGWKIGNEVIADAETSISTTVGALRSTYGIEAITLTPIKELNSNVSSSSFNFTLNGTSVASDIAYDKKVTITAPEGTYAIVINDGGTYVPVVYCDEDNMSYSFNACNDLDFYTMTKVDSDYIVDPDGDGVAVATVATTDEETLLLYNNKLPFAYSFVKMTGTQTGSVTENGETTVYGNKWTTYSAYTVNSSVPVSEYGTLRVVGVSDSNTLRVENITAENGIVKMAGSTNLYYSNQYSYSLSTSNATPRMVSTRAYVKFRWTYSGKEIDSVSYSGICVSNYGVPVQP